MMQGFNPQNWPIDWDATAYSALAVGISVVLAYLLYVIVFKLISKLTKLSEINVDDMIVRRVRRPIKWSFLAIGVTLAAQTDDTLRTMWEPLAQFLRPLLLGWIAYNVVKGITAALEIYVLRDSDPLESRSKLTRIAVVSRVAIFAIILVTVGLMMYSIPAVRAIGTTMLASAGLAALVIGAAAQPALKSLIAGLQVALTEPMRIGDLVKVDGEVGRVEQIRMSYVTVRIWDERVLVVPTGRFLDESFENWSHEDERLSGAVFLHLDPSAAVAPVREEFSRYVTAHDMFDGRDHAALLVETYPESIAIRLTMTADSPADLWALRCAVREHMLGWIQANMPDALIRHRLEVPGGHEKAGEPSAP